MQTNTRPAEVHPPTLFVITPPQPAHASIAILSMSEPIASKMVAQHRSREISAIMPTKLVNIEGVIALRAGAIARVHLVTVQIFDPALRQALAIHHQGRRILQHRQLECRCGRKRQAFEIETLLRSDCLRTINTDR